MHLEQSPSPPPPKREVFSTIFHLHKKMLSLHSKHTVKEGSQYGAWEKGAAYDSRRSASSNFLDAFSSGLKENRFHHLTRDPSHLAEVVLLKDNMVPGTRLWAYIWVMNAGCISHSHQIRHGAPTARYRHLHGSCSSLPVLRNTQGGFHCFVFFLLQFLLFFVLLLGSCFCVHVCVVFCFDFFVCFKHSTETQQEIINQLNAANH